MAVSAENASTSLAAPIAEVADAHRVDDLAIRVEVEATPVAAPPELIEAVVETLIENSRQAGAREVLVMSRAAGDRVLLSISDDGPGIAASEHERIFEPFHTSRRTEGGSGLGLSIARSLLASVGATIVSRPAERGALFEISLPRAG
jgi:two-component system, OmpR family, sensor histidine kinase ChvG